jgi:hypothetical protein
MIRILLPDRHYAEINKCGQNPKPINVVNFSGTQLECQQISIFAGVLFNPLVESNWNGVTSQMNNLACLQYNGQTWVILYINPK